MIAINYDAQMVFGKLYEREELFQMATALYLYALSKGKAVKIDPDTKMVTIE